MPQYELMYIIGSQTSDDEIPKISEEVKKSIETEGGLISKFEELGKKKLAYPIKKSRTGHYALVNFTVPAEKIESIEQKIRTSLVIIRHLIINMDEALVQLEKDRKDQARLKLARPQEEETAKPAPSARPERKIQIDLDAEIEKALDSKDLK